MCRLLAFSGAYFVVRIFLLRANDRVVSSASLGYTKACLSIGALEMSFPLSVDNRKIVSPERVKGVFRLTEIIIWHSFLVVKLVE